jgi:hypothetical protein
MATNPEPYLLPGGITEVRFLKNGDLFERKSNLMRVVRATPYADRVDLAVRDLDDHVMRLLDLPDRLEVELYDEVTEQEYNAAMAGQAGHPRGE